MIKCIVFDLDGTLVKSHETIYKTTVSTLKSLNLSVQFDKQKFYYLLGHHFRDIFSGCGIEVPNMENFINIYKKKYFEYLNYSVLYPNAIETLKTLNEKNIKLGLLTTKLHDQAILLTKHFGLDNYLDKIEGRKNNIPHKPSPEQFKIICENFNIETKYSMMVGDTELDILCGKNANAVTCAVKFGYRKLEELKLYKPDYMIDNLKEILNLVEQN